jgi:hypothetical protein
VGHIRSHIVMHHIICMCVPPATGRDACANLTSKYPWITIPNSQTLMAQTAKVVQLNPQTLQAYIAYIRDAEAGMERTLHGDGPFLWSDARSERAQQVGDGHIVAQLWSGRGPVKVPDGLIHDWIGAVFVPATTIDKTLALVQDYDNHKNIYKPEVMDSALISHHDNDFQIYLRILKKKIITVVLDTDHDVHYLQLDRARCSCRSYTTRIAEVENPGTPKEKVLPPDSGHGFLWRLYSYWRFQEKEDGVYVECRAISLTRDVPFGLGWVIEPIIQNLPRESLIKTLEATRRALQRSLSSVRRQGKTRKARTR